MVLGQGMRASVAGLRLAAADMAALGAQPQVERRAALLTSIAARRRDDLRGVRTGPESAVDRIHRRQLYPQPVQDPSAVRELLALVRGHRLTDIVTTAARLGIPDAIAGGATEPEAIALATATHAPTLTRLLRALAAAGVVHEADDGTFALTAMGEAMRTDVPGSVAPWVALLDRDYMHVAWRNLEHSVRTGENTFAAVNGEDIWAWRDARPEEGAIFDRAMTSMSAGIGGAVTTTFDFSGSRVVADIAGGAGLLLADVLRANPHLRGVLFDQPSVVHRELAVRAPEFAGRCEVVGGSFFESVPAGADVYLLKAILHDWEDVESLAILRNIRAVIPDTGTLLVIERVVGPRNEDLEGRLSDLHMLVMPGGRERTRDEWTTLLAGAGFRLDDVRPLRGPWSLIVAPPAAIEAGA